MRFPPARTRFPAILSILALALLALTGCGAGAPAATSATGAIRLQGRIHGGQQPVSGAAIQLYDTTLAAGSGAATPMLLIAVTSNALGAFTITGDYTCPHATDQVLLVAQGGNPGLTPGSNNPALTMVAALGPCGNLAATTFTSINEITTVAAAWALSPFLSSATTVNNTPSNPTGLANAFLNTRLLADPTSGALATLPIGRTVESGKILALANSLAACVNSSGGTSCTPLFTAATPLAGTAPTDTFTAALNIVKNPGNNVAAIFAAGSSVAPYPTALTQAPSDWTMSLSVTGGGLDDPAALAIDAPGNIWVASYNGVLSSFSPQGVALSPTGYGLGTLSESLGITIDPSNDIWVSSENQPAHGSTNGSIAKFQGALDATPGQLVGVFYDNTMEYPSALAADTNGDIFVSNYYSSLAETYSNQGALLASNLGAGYTSFPLAIAADSTHGLWLANGGDGTITHIDSNGSVVAHPQCCDGADAIAVDALGNAWAANYYGSSVSEIGASGTLVQAPFTGGGIDSPAGIAIDGAQDVWVADYPSGTLTHLAGNRTGVTAGAALSPAAGFGRDAGIVDAAALAIDPSGGIWVADGGRHVVVEFFGLASPTKTPLDPTPSAP